MTPRERHVSSHALAPVLLLISVAVAIVVQLGAPLPLAGAVALAGWGTALAAGSRATWGLLTVVVYLPLVALAIAAQLDVAQHSGSLGRQFVAAVDSGAAVGLLILLVRRWGAMVGFGRR